MSLGLVLEGDVDRFGVVRAELEYGLLMGSARPSDEVCLQLGRGIGIRHPRDRHDLQGPHELHGRSSYVARVEHALDAVDGENAPGAVALLDELPGHRVDGLDPGGGDSAT